MNRALAAAAFAGLLVAGCSSAPPTPAAPRATSTTTQPATTTSTTRVATTTSTPATGRGPCGTLALDQARYSHVLWVWMENHSYGSIIGSSSAPYINSLAGSCGLATNYHNITHPSLPNYLATTSGMSEQAVGAFSSDCDPTPSCESSGASLFGQGETWKSYVEDMPAPCGRGSTGEYAARHNPAVYYTALAGCPAFDVPYPALGQDLADGRLPAFSFVTPNVLDDMHDGTVADGDRWLAANLPMLLESNLFRLGHLVVFLTWDEGEGGSAGDCATNTTDVGCHVATLVLSATTRPGTRAGALFNHWSLLRTTEELLHLPLLGEAASAPSMRSAFNL